MQLNGSSCRLPVPRRCKQEGTLGESVTIETGTSVSVAGYAMLGFEGEHQDCEDLREVGRAKEGVLIFRDPDFPCVDDCPACKDPRGPLFHVPVEPGVPEEESE